MRVRCSPERTGRALRARWGSAARSRLGDEGGFTITESVTGLAILFIVILALVASITVAVRGILTGRQRSTALAVAEKTMEEIRSVDFERIGHVSSDTTLTGGCSTSLPVAGSGTTDWVWNGKTYTYSGAGATEPIAIANSGTAIVGPSSNEIPAHCTTGTEDGTPYEQWVYVTVVDSTATQDAQKRVTIVVQFRNEQYDSATIENKAKISSLVFPGDGLEQPRILVESDANAGGFSMSGDPGSDFDGFTASYARSDAEMISHAFDRVGGSASYASASYQASGVTADNPPCTVSGTVATCAAGTALTNPTTGDDDAGTTGIPPYPTPSTVTSTAGQVEADDTTVDWHGGTATAQQSACYGGAVGTCGPAFATPPFTAWPAALPLARHRGYGPRDMSTSTDIDLPGRLPVITVDWLAWVGDAEAESSADQRASGATGKLTTPIARAKVPAVDVARVNGTRLLGVTEVEVEAEAPVGYNAVDADVTATVVTLTVAGVALPLTIDPTSGSSVNASIPALPLGAVVVVFDVTAVAGNLTETESRNGLTVEDSTASLLDALVITLNVEIIACGVGNTDPICTTDAIPPTTVADVSLVLDYGDVVATGTHRDP